MAGKGFSLGAAQRQARQRKGRPFKPTRKPRRIPVGKGTPMSSTRPPRVIAPMPGLRPPTPNTQAPKPAAAGAMPLDPTYDAQAALARARHQQAGAGFDYEALRTKQTFGFDDASDPYSRARMLERSYLQGQAGTTGGMASRGQLYSGALQTQLDEGTHTYSRNRSALRGEYQDALNRIQQGRLSADTDYQSALTDAQAARLERALATRADDPGEPSPAAGVAQRGGQKGTPMRPPRKPRRIRPVKGRTVKGRKPRRIRRV